MVVDILTRMARYCSNAVVTAVATGQKAAAQVIRLQLVGAGQAGADERCVAITGCAVIGMGSCIIHR
jgi:hypothetical protein